MSTALASSQCCWSPSRQTENLGRGVDFSLGKEGRKVRVSDRPAPPACPWSQHGDTLPQHGASCTAAHLPSPAGRWGQPGGCRTSPHVLRPRVRVRPAAPTGPGRAGLPKRFGAAAAPSRSRAGQGRRLGRSERMANLTVPENRLSFCGS